MDLTWKQAGACRRLDPAMFYPVSEDDAGPALAVCARCAVRAPCLEFAMTWREWDGVWGGTTGSERRAMGRRAANERRRAAAAAAAAAVR